MVVLNIKLKNYILHQVLRSTRHQEKIPTSENEMLKVPDVYNPRYSYGTGKILTEVMGINYGRKFLKN